MNIPKGAFHITLVCFISKPIYLPVTIWHFYSYFTFNEPFDPWVVFVVVFFFYLFGSGGSQKPFKLTFDKLFLYIALCYSQ